MAGRGGLDLQFHDGGKVAETQVDRSRRGIRRGGERFEHRIRGQMAGAARSLLCLFGRDADRDDKTVSVARYPGEGRIGLESTACDGRAAVLPLGRDGGECGGSAGNLRRLIGIIDADGLGTVEGIDPDPVPGLPAEGGEIVGEAGAHRGGRAAGREDDRPVGR